MHIVLFFQSRTFDPICIITPKGNYWILTRAQAEMYIDEEKKYEN